MIPPPRAPSLPKQAAHQRTAPLRPSLPHSLQPGVFGAPHALHTLVWALGRLGAWGKLPHGDQGVLLAAARIAAARPPGEDGYHRSNVLHGLALAPAQWYREADTRCGGLREKETHHYYTATTSLNSHSAALYTHEYTTALLHHCILITGSVRQSCAPPSWRSCQHTQYTQPPHTHKCIHMHTHTYACSARPPSSVMAQLAAHHHLIYTRYITITGPFDIPRV